MAAAACLGDEVGREGGWGRGGGELVGEVDGLGGAVGVGVWGGDVEGGAGGVHGCEGCGEGA